MLRGDPLHFAGCLWLPSPCFAMLLVLGLATGLLVGSPVARRGPSIAMSGIYDLAAEKIDGSSMSLGDCKGSPVLMVNVASR